jgi:hypothetical protein
MTQISEFYPQRNVQYHFNSRGPGTARWQRRCLPPSKHLCQPGPTRDQKTNQSEWLWVLAAKVEEQNSQIEAIHQAAQESTDFVRQAARHITQATKHGVSFRFLLLPRLNLSYEPPLQGSVGRGMCLMLIALIGGSVLLLVLHAIIP